VDRTGTRRGPLPADIAAKKRLGDLTDPGVERRDCHVEEAILSRRSVRAFLPDPVPAPLLRRLLEVARWAPSGSNIQPWKIHVLTGASQARLSEALFAAMRNKEPREMEYHYYAPVWREPFLARRRACGFGLYGAMGIACEDTAARSAAFARNYAFFDAPAAMLFWIASDLEHGSWMDYGMFIHSLALAARGFGLATIAQGALGAYPHVAHRLFGVGPDFKLIGGMSLGWADPDAPVNAFQPDRLAVDDFTTWLD